MSVLRPKRKPVKNGVFLFSARLVTDGPTGQTELGRHDYELPIADTQVCGNSEAVANSLVLWLDDLGQRYVRQGTKR